MADFRLMIVGENPQWRESLSMAFRAGSTGQLIASQSSEEFFSDPCLYPDVLVWKIEEGCPDNMIAELAKFCSLPILVVDNPKLPSLLILSGLSLIKYQALLPFITILLPTPCFGINCFTSSRSIEVERLPLL